MNTFTRQRDRDTPTRSPFARSSTPQPRSPTKPSHKQELGLALERVIGTTCNSSTRLSVDAASQSFAYVAGAAVVLSTLASPSRSLADDDAPKHRLAVTQRFFRANASLTSVRPSAANGPGTPSALNSDLRRLTRHTREGSPFTPSHGHSDAVADSPGATSGHAKDRVKAVTAVALSPGGKWLAYGESGYRPRVLIFPVTKRKSTEVPSAIISEHSFGVQALAWDDNGKMLASLGTVNDGFLHVWSVGERGEVGLLASNKCTVAVKSMAWIGRSLVTVGVRHVKIWRVDEVAASMGVEDGEGKKGLSDPGFRPLVGRNSLLGDLLEVTFTAIVPIGENQAVICSDQGDVVLLDDSDKQARLTRICVLQFAITAACMDESGKLIVAGANGRIQQVDVSTSNRSDTPLSRASTPVTRKLGQKIAVHPLAIGKIGNVVVVADNRRTVRLSSMHDLGAYGREESAAELMSHSEPILGICVNDIAKGPETAFATWSAAGKVIGWTTEGRQSVQVTVPLDQIHDAYDVTNELRAISFLQDTPYIVIGDRYGVVRVMDPQTDRVRFEARAHSSEVSSVVTSTKDGQVLVATASRDRTVQLFGWKHDQLELLQTLDEHAGAVSEVILTKDGRHLISCSADRSVVIREALDEDGGPLLFGIVRTVPLKSAPLAMALANEGNQIILSTADRNVHLIALRTGNVLSTFKSGDTDGGDTVALVGLCIVPSSVGPPLIAGVCGSDKSVRIYSDDGTLQARDWGHTEGVTGIAHLPNDDRSNAKLVSTAADGTIFMWSPETRKTLPQLTTSRAEELTSTDVPSSSPLARPPLRKVISQSEMNRIQMRRSMVSPNQDSESDSPSGLKSPPPSALRKRPSRLSVGQGPRLEPSTPSTPTRCSGSPVTRHRSPSPSRESIGARSTSMSPDRPSPVRRRSSLADMRRDRPSSPLKLESNGLHLPLRPALSRTSSADPSKSTSSTSDSTEELLIRIRAYRNELKSQNERPEQDLALRAQLVSELDDLREALKACTELLGGRETGSTMADLDPEDGLGGGAEVLESVEEASELDIKAG